jgi:hypothetical protein
MRVVVKVSGHGPKDPEWIGYDRSDGTKQLVPHRKSARIFTSEAAANLEIAAFRSLLLIADAEFEIERQ